MKNLRNTAFLLSLASLSLIGGDLFAQSGNVRLGYCTTSYSRGLVAQGQTGSHIYQAAVKFRHSDLIDISPHKIICKRVFAGIPVILRELPVHPCFILQCYLVKYCFFWFHKYLNS